MTDEELTRLAAERVLGELGKDDDWRPLLYMEDAWMLVIALLARGWHFVLVCSTEDYARARFERMDGDQLIVRVAEEDDPLRAIVIAALRAVGEEV